MPKSARLSVNRSRQARRRGPATSRPRNRRRRSPTPVEIITELTEYNKHTWDIETNHYRETQTLKEPTLPKLPTDVYNETHGHADARHKWMKSNASHLTDNEHVFLNLLPILNIYCWARYVAIAQTVASQDGDGEVVLNDNALLHKLEDNATHTRQTPSEAADFHLETVSLPFLKATSSCNNSLVSVTSSEDPDNTAIEAKYFGLTEEEMQNGKLGKGSGIDEFSKDEHHLAINESSLGESYNPMVLD